MASKARFLDNVGVSAFGTNSGGGSSISSSYALSASYADSATSASYAISASYEITKEVSSSYADTASFAQSGDGIFSGSFSGSFQGDGSNLTGVEAFPFSGSAVITGSLTITGSQPSGFLSTNPVEKLDLGRYYFKTKNSFDTGLLGSFGGELIISSSDFDYKTPMVVLDRTQGPFGNDIGTDLWARNNLFAGGSTYVNGVINTLFSVTGSGQTGQGGVINLGNPYNIAPTTNVIALHGHLTASSGVNISGSATSTASFGTYLGDGSQLTGIETNPFPFTGSAIITGSLNVIGSVTSTNNVSASNNIFSKQHYVEGKLALDYNNGIAIGNLSDSLNLLGTSITASSNLSSSATSTASFGTYLGDGSQLTGIETNPFPYTGSAIISGSTPLTLQGGTTNSDTVLLAENSSGLDLLTVKGDGEIIINNASNGLTGKLSFGNGISDGFIYMQDLATGPSSKYSIPQRTSNNDSSLQFWVGNTAAGPKLFPHKDTSQGLADRSVIEIDLYNSNNNSRGLDFIVGGAAVTTTYQPKLWRFFSWDGVNDPDSGNVERLSIGNSPLTTGGDAIIAISSSRVGIGAPSPSASLEINPPSGSFPSLIVSGSSEFIGNISGSATSTSSFGTYLGDGSQLTGISTTPFPFTGDAVISGSLTVQSGSTNSITGITLVNPSNPGSTEDTGAGITMFNYTGATGSIYIKDYTSGGLNPYHPAMIFNSSDAFYFKAADDARDGTWFTAQKVYQNFHMDQINNNAAEWIMGINNGGSSYSRLVIGQGSTTTNGWFFQNNGYDEDLKIGETTGAGGTGTYTNRILISSSRMQIGDSSNDLKLSVSGSITSNNTSSAAYFVGDGSQLTNLPTSDPFPYSGSAIISSSGATASLTLEGSGSTVFDVIGSQGTLFSVDDDLSGTIFTANDISGLPILEASASGDVYIGKSPQSLYTTAVISSTTAAVTQSIFGLSTSSYDGAFFDYTIQSGSNARAGSIMSVWNGSTINFTETTTTDIGNTTDFNLIVHISQSQAQIASHATNAGYKIKTIIRSI